MINIQILTNYFLFPSAEFWRQVHHSSKQLDSSSPPDHCFTLATLSTFLLNSISFIQNSFIFNPIFQKAQNIYLSFSLTAWLSFGLIPKENDSNLLALLFDHGNHLDLTLNALICFPDSSQLLVFDVHHFYFFNFKHQCKALHHDPIHFIMDNYYS